VCGEIKRAINFELSVLLTFFTGKVGKGKKISKKKKHQNKEASPIPSSSQGAFSPSNAKRAEGAPRLLYSSLSSYLIY